MVVEPRRAGFVVEIPITEVLLRDDDTKLGDESSVEGVLKSAFAFPFKNGYMFIANEGLFNDIDLESIDGGTIHTGKSVIPADVMITSDGMAVGKKENLKSALQKAQQKEPKVEEPEETETAEKTGEPEVPTPPEEPTPAKEPQKDEKPLIKGKELTTIKEVFSSEEQTEESEETEEAEVVEEDKTLVEQATDAAKDFLAEKRDELIEDLVGRAKKIAQESIAEARANLSFSKMVNQPKATVNQFKKDLWENFKSKTKEEAKTLYGEAKDAIEGIDDAVMDEISSAVWTKASELTDKMEWLNDVISNAAAFLNVAKELGIESEKIEKMQGTVDMMLDAMANFQEQSEEKLQQVFPKDEKEEEEEPEEEEDDSKRISISFNVVPGFDVSLFLEPAYSLSFGGYLNLHPGYKGEPITIDLGVDAYGFASLTVGVGATAGNKLMAVFGEIAGKAELFGILGDHKKFATMGLDNLQIGAVTENGPEIGAPMIEGVSMHLGGEVDGTLSAMIAAKSELFDWEKVLLDGKVTAALGTAEYDAEAKKEGGKVSQDERICG